MQRFEGVGLGCCCRIRIEIGDLGGMHAAWRLLKIWRSRIFLVDGCLVPMLNTLSCVHGISE